MIFVCCGTQVYQFDRLLIELDNLIKNGVIEKDELFVQTGTLNYIPKYYSYKPFLSHEEFDEYILKADLIISHGGTGALIGASKLGKNIIAVPRLKQFGEHVDDHQIQIVKILEKHGYIRAVYDINSLGNTIIDAKERPIKNCYNAPSNVIPLIENQISSWFSCKY